MHGPSGKTGAPDHTKCSSKSATSRLDNIRTESSLIQAIASFLSTSDLLKSFRTTLWIGTISKLRFRTSPYTVSVQIYTSQTFTDHSEDVKAGIRKVQNSVMVSRLRIVRIKHTYVANNDLLRHVWGGGLHANARDRIIRTSICPRKDVTCANEYLESVRWNPKFEKVGSRDIKRNSKH